MPLGDILSWTYHEENSSPSNQFPNEALIHDPFRRMDIQSGKNLPSNVNKFTLTDIESTNIVKKKYFSRRVNCPSESNASLNEKLSAHSSTRRVSTNLLTAAQG